MIPETEDRPIGSPAFALSPDLVLTAVDLVLTAAAAIRTGLVRDLNETRLSRRLMRAMVRAKRANPSLQMRIGREVIVEDYDEEGDEDAVEGRIDLVIVFPHQHAEERAYFAIEAKVVRAGGSNGRYVTQGMVRFQQGLYGPDNPWGMMLGYVRLGPVSCVTAPIQRRIKKSFGPTACWQPQEAHPLAMAQFHSVLARTGHRQPIELVHAFVDMSVPRGA
jgi:hypothetical protein